jgi:hypothetical protein
VWDLFNEHVEAQKKLKAAINVDLILARMRRRERSA